MVAHKDLANALRFLAAEGVQKANSGHPACRWVWRTSQPFYFQNF